MTLSFIAKIKEMQGQAPSLVVAPTSVIDVWILEAKRHLPNIEILKWHGLSRFDKVKDIGSSDIVVTSFALLRRDACKVLNKVKFRHLIVDEAQYVKNCKTETWKIIKNIKAGQKIAITGTPIENSVNDIWSILEFLTPKILGDEKSFSRYYTIPIKNGNQFRLKELKNRIKPVVLRRNKKDVEKDLPKKIESIICCEMGEIQRSLYQNIVRGAEKEINKVSNFYKNSISFLSILTRLRQMCCDPSINLGNKSESGIPSAKKDLLIDVLNNCFAMKRKIIIYSQFLSMQKIIYKTIKTLGINEILWLHGGVKNRSEIIDKFQCDKSCRVIIISLKAGGSGITLTAADTIIYYDPWWNPAVEDQASDRAHRIGQTKNIHIIKLICKNTIEEQIIELSNKKRRSAEGILSNKTMSSTSLTFTEIKNLFLKEISNNK
jgi:non-specific serine/threonine protein kinase